MNTARQRGDQVERLTTSSRVLVGIDRSPESREAARQAAILVQPAGEPTLLAVYDIAPAIIDGTGPGTPATSTRTCNLAMRRMPMTILAKRTKSAQAASCIERAGSAALRSPQPPLDARRK
jgi:hypothetical protein